MAEQAKPYNQIEELNHYYRHTIIGYKEDDKIYPYHVNDFYKESGKVKITGDRLFIDKDECYWCPLNIILDEECVSLTHPEMGIINLPEYAVHLKRVPYRQYKKAYYENNIQVNYVNYSECIKLGVQLYNSTDPKFLMSVFNPESLPIQDSINQIRNGDRLSAAIDRRFFLISLLYNKDIMIGYKNYLIGKLNDQDQVVLFPSASHHREDLVRYIPIVEETYVKT